MLCCIKMAWFLKGGKAVKMLKTIYYERSLVTNFVQACSLIAIYNVMYFAGIPQYVWSKIDENRCKQKKYEQIQVMGELYRYIP